ncbi:hypothetical protein AgCh_029790 [Apium graveolens]
MQFGLDQELPSDVVRSSGSLQIAWNNYNKPTRDAMSLATTASLSCNLEETPHIYVAENDLTSVQHTSQLRNVDSSGKINDLDDGPILNSYSDVEEDD